jgi:phosphotransferase system HPr (HPr) family protein
MTPTAGTAMTAPGTAVRRSVVVANPMGLHMRPASAFAQTAQRYAAAVTVWNGQTRADGKSMLELILLVAMPGAELVVEADGEDASAAVERLAEILADPGDGL